MLIPDTYLTVHEELILFLGSVILGCALELIFDIFRSLRVIIPHKAAANAIEDIIFIMIWAGSIACFTSIFAKGYLRIFYIVGSILGFVLCKLTVGDPLVRLLSMIWRFILRFIRWIFTPAIKIYTWIYNKYVQKIVNNAKIRRCIKNIWSAPLIAVRKMLYNIFNNRRKMGETKGDSEKKESKT